MKLHLLALSVVLTSLGEAPASAQTKAPAPPSNLSARDHRKWDDGTRIDLAWDLPADDDTLVADYRISKAPARFGDFQVPLEFELVEIVKAGTSEYTVRDLAREIRLENIQTNYADIVDIEGLEATNQKKFPVAYVFEIVAVGREGAKSAAAATQPITPTMEWFDGYRFWVLIVIVIFCGAVIMFIQMARGGRPLKVRKIAGLEAVDEAVGRATEMGRSVLFIPGITDMNDIQTIAGINILARVAKTAAGYEAKIEVPTSRSLVMATARETVHGAFLEAGRPDAYNKDLIYYVTDEQFGYVAYVQGMMVREKPAACFYMGSFFAESLILAETGNSIGAIQVAGTAQAAQLPFFVAACDYTLIGEEFFAASAYLSGSPEELGSLKGQDVGKLIVGLGIIIGVVMLSAAAIILARTPGSPLGTALLSAVEYLKQVILT